MTMPVNDAVPGAVRQLRHLLQVPGLARAMAAYFSPGGGFRRGYIHLPGRVPRDAVTASDLLGRLAAVRSPGGRRQSRQLLDIGAETVAGGCCAPSAAISTVWEDSSDEDLAAVDPLWDALLQMPKDIGTATTSKLLARKRHPQAVRVSDRSSSERSACPAGPGKHCARSCKTPPHARRRCGRRRPPRRVCGSLTWRSGYTTPIPGPPAASAGTATSPSRAQPPVTPGAPAHADVCVAECFRPRSRRIVSSQRRRRCIKIQPTRCPPGCSWGYSYAASGVRSS